MPHISRKKIPFSISPALRSYLVKYGREIRLPIEYKDLLRYEAEVVLYDKYKQDTLWVSVQYPQSDIDYLYSGLKEIYAIMMADGDMSVMEHLYVDRIDLCLYGNTQPFRIRIRNRINDNYDYYYIKNADASRVIGLELEHLLSPNRMNYRVFNQTLIEEHIAGIPGKEFIKNYIEKDRVENHLRLAKEFVKFNERCFVRLLGDMHSSNFVVDITPDFEDVHYRIRAIDFDQQCYEPRRSVYFPKYYKQNLPFINIGIQNITPETSRQYQKEERSMIARRIRYAHEELDDLLIAMKGSILSKEEYIIELRKDLFDYYNDPQYLKCRNMGEVVELGLSNLVNRGDSV